jgi:ArsR family transcriptional regulator, arsenate/arsenite/antimonite-responsive transcriptional repressor
MSVISISINMPTAEKPVTEDALTLMLRALADPTRRRILGMLKQRGCCSIGKDVGLCACDIEAQIDLSQPTISHHMAVLKDAGLVQSEKIGQWMWYRRNEPALRRMERALTREL